MKLPLLAEPKAGTELKLVGCEGGKRCPSCVLYKKRCEGCSASHRAGFDRVFDNFRECYTECNTCTGYEVQVPAICCRSPLKDAYLSAMTKGAADPNKPVYEFTERPKLSFKSKAVVYIASGGVNTIAPAGVRLVPDGTEAVAVNLTRVWGSNGWFSRDLKDYLHLSPKTKLLLMTITRDDLLERAFQNEFYADPLDYQKVGLDAWMPLSFSGYLEQAHMHQYYQFLRTHFCIERSQAWFASADHHFPGLRTDDIVLEAVKKIPQMIITPHGSYDMSLSVPQQIMTPTPNGTHLNAIRHYHNLVPSNVAFWFVGPGAMKPSYMATVRKLVGRRECYWVSPRPFYLASKGQRVEPTGKFTKVAMPKLELVAENIKTHTAMVKSYG